MLLYVEGDVGAAKKKIAQAGAQNSPERIKAFAASLRQLEQVPGADSFMGPVLEVARLLDTQAAASLPGGPSAPAGQPPGAAQSAGGGPSAAAPSVPSAPAWRPPADMVLERIEGGVAAPGSDPSRVACGATFGEGAGYCVRVVEGPFILTDRYVAPGCPNELFAMAGTLQASRWTITGPATTPLGVHGARLAVRGGESLYIGAQAPTSAKLSSDPRCAVTWSGFRPYLESAGAGL